MLFSELHLRAQVNPPVDAATLGHRLTMAGLEVDALKPWAPPLPQVVVGRVLACAPHPNADRLRVTQVDVGQPEPLQIVCGAPNVRVGLTVAVACVGAELPGPLVIRAATLRGVASAGMLCGADELGLPPAGEGLMELAPELVPGTSIRDALQLNDHQIELGITPNRGDCHSIRGLARETAALFQLPVDLSLPSPVPVTMTAEAASTPAVRVEEPQACPRYLGRCIVGLRPDTPSPAWLVDGLQRAGFRSVDLLVDVTQWVMYQLGQPLHAFDADLLGPQVVVRRARPQESLTLLDGQSVTLVEQPLVIANAQDAVALAGVMGGQSTAVHAKTTSVFLEAAHFDPLALAGTARRHGLHTDAAQRFERGVDPELPEAALNWATQLIVAAAGGDVGPVVRAEHTLPAKAPVVLRRQQVTRVLGLTLSDDAIEALLTPLGLTMTRIDGGWQVHLPSHRFDLHEEVDLIEEIARLHGYDQLPVSAPRTDLTLTPQSESTRSLRELQQVLLARDYQEAITFSFVSPEQQRRVDPMTTPLVLSNPLSTELSVMRTSLWPGLLQAVAHNQARQQTRVRLFEAGLRFLPGPDEALEQSRRLAGVVSGSAESAGWAQTARPVDFFDVKGDVMAILASVNRAHATFHAATHPACHPGQCAEVRVHDQVIGVLGAVHPHLLRTLDLTGPVLVFELDLDALLTGAALPQARLLSRFPEVSRDLALLVPESVTVAEVLTVIRAQASEALTQVAVFDRYVGAPVAAGWVSLAITCVWQHPDRTLQEAEVQAEVQAILSALAQSHQVTLRG